jgi:hypothetical protein
VYCISVSPTLLRISDSCQKSTWIHHDRTSFGLKHIVCQAIPSRDLPTTGFYILHLRLIGPLPHLLIPDSLRCRVLPEKDNQKTAGHLRKTESCWLLSRNVSPRCALADLPAHRTSGGPIIIWSQVSACLPGRNNKACRKRWIHSLDPTLRKGGGRDHKLECGSTVTHTIVRAMDRGRGCNSHVGYRDAWHALVPRQAQSSSHMLTDIDCNVQSLNFYRGGPTINAQSAGEKILTLQFQGKRGPRKKTISLWGDMRGWASAGKTSRLALKAGRRFIVVTVCRALSEQGGARQRSGVQ